MSNYGVKILGTGYPFYAWRYTLTPILTPNLGPFLLLKNSSFNSENGLILLLLILHGLFLLFLESL